MLWPVIGRSCHEPLDFESLQNDLKPTLDNAELTGQSGQPLALRLTDQLGISALNAGDH